MMEKGMKTYLYYVFYIACHVSGKTALILKKQTNAQNWLGAQKACNGDNGYLATLENLRMNNVTDTMPGEIWVGDYKTMSSWMDIIGCYSDQTGNTMSSVVQTTLQNNQPGFCQQQCHSYRYFALKGETCICIRNVSALDGNTTCEVWNGLIGGTNSYTIFKNLTSLLGKIDKTLCSSVDCNCMQAGCVKNKENKRITHYKSRCNESIKTLCRNQNEFGLGNTWTKGLNKCIANKSLPIEFNTSDTICVATSQAPFWTSTFRQPVKLNTYWNFANKRNLEYFNECMSISYNGSYHGSWNKRTQCDSERKCFYCAFSELSTTSIQPTSVSFFSSERLEAFNLTVESTMNEQSTPSMSSEIFYFTTEPQSPSNDMTSDSVHLTTQSSSSTRLTDSPTRLNYTENIADGAKGPIIGTIVAVLVILAAMAVVAVYIKRRRKAPTNYSETSDKSDTKVIFPEPEHGKIDENIMKNNGKLSSGYELAKPVHNNEQIPASDNKENSSYELAHIVNDNGNDYAYRDTEEGEYDLLNEKTKRKITENSNENNTYAHTGFKEDNEDTYDSMYNKNIKKEDYNSYDTTRFTIKDNAYDITKNSDENPYDHTNI